MRTHLKNPPNIRLQHQPVCSVQLQKYLGADEQSSQTYSDFICRFFYNQLILTTFSCHCQNKIQKQPTSLNYNFFKLLQKRKFIFWTINMDCFLDIALQQRTMHVNTNISLDASKHASDLNPRHVLSTFLICTSISELIKRSVSRNLVLEKIIFLSRLIIN